MGIVQFIKKITVQTAVYWGAPKPDGFGTMMFDIPKEIKVRWQGATELYVKGGPASPPSDMERGQNLSSIMVNDDLELNGFIWLGTLEELKEKYYPEPTAILDPSKVVGAYQIKKFDKVPMLKSTKIFVRTVYI